MALPKKQEVFYDTVSPGDTQLTETQAKLKSELMQNRRPSWQTPSFALFIDPTLYIETEPLYGNSKDCLTLDGIQTDLEELRAFVEMAAWLLQQKGTPNYRGNYVLFGSLYSKLENVYITAIGGKDIDEDTFGRNLS